MEAAFSQLTLDIIGKSVFNYDFNALTNDSPLIQAVYTSLKETESRATDLLPYWKVGGGCWGVGNIGIRVQRVSNGSKCIKLVVLFLWKVARTFCSLALTGHQKLATQIVAILVLLHSLQIIWPSKCAPIPE